MTMQITASLDTKKTINSVWQGPETGAESDKRARAIVSSDASESDKRRALLGLALEDPRFERELVRVDDGDGNRALSTLEGKILGDGLSRRPLDLDMIAEGYSFSGWLYKTFKAVLADAVRRGRFRRGCEVSIDRMLAPLDAEGMGGLGFSAQSLGLAVFDDYRPRNPYQSIVMRRPMEDTYLRVERAMKLSGSGVGGLDAGLAVLHQEGWKLSEETDLVDERLILSLVMPRLRRHEVEVIDRQWPGLGTAMLKSVWAAKKYEQSKLRVWKILDAEAERLEMGSMGVWERVTHCLFDMRWFAGG